MMHVTSAATNDTGLSESTYELITGTDSESMDGNYTESMEDSVDSLDFHRPDDARSEHTHDDESVLDETNPRPHAIAGGPALLIDIDNDGPGDVHDEETDDADTESDDGAESRSSLDYTQQSLKAPSIATPEPRKPDYWLDDDVDLPTLQERLKYYAELVGILLYGGVLAVLPAAIFGSCLIFAVSMVNPPPVGNNVGHAVANMTKLDVPSTTPTLATTIITSTTRPSYATLASSLPDDTNDWLVAARKPPVRMSSHPSGLLLEMDAEIQKAWSKKGCLDIQAKRGDVDIAMGVEPSEGGVLIKLPKDERRGLVSVHVESSCRPKMQKTWDVDLRKSIMEEAEHLANLLLTDLGIATQKTMECLKSGKQLTKFTPGTLLQDIQSVSNGMAKAAMGSLVEARKTIYEATEEVGAKLRRGASMTTTWMHDLPLPPVPRVPDTTRDYLKLQFVTSQVTAKLMWLKFRQSREDYVASKARAREFLALRHADKERAARPKPRVWDRLMGRHRGCQLTAQKGRRGVHQCVAEA
jgi:hypothetical protein